MKVALNQAQAKPLTVLETDEDDENKQPVVFVISLQNYGGQPGFRLNNENLTAHLPDQELILKDGTQMWVNAVEKVEIPGKLSQNHVLHKFSGKLLTFIYLCKVG